jgi:hypothetical protein
LGPKVPSNFQQAYLNSDVFALYVGGSALFEADDKDTDLDMTIILPNIVAESLKCGYCKLKRRLCQKHNVIFSDIEGSFYLHLNNAIKQDKELDIYVSFLKGKLKILTC